MTTIYGTRGEDGRTLAWPLLAWAVRDRWGWRTLPPVERSPRGKPFFPGEAGRWFSLSHSGGIALCALSEDGPVGVDVELVRPRRAGLPAYVLSPAELVQAGGRPPVPAPAGGDAAALPPRELGRGGLAGGGVLLRAAAGGDPLGGGGTLKGILKKISPKAKRDLP